MFDYLQGTSTGSQLGSNLTGNWNLRIDDDLGGSMLSAPVGISQGLDTWTQVCINVDRGAAQVEVFFDAVSQAVIPLVDSASGLPLTGSVYPSMDLQIGVINGGSIAGQAQDCGLDDLAFYDGLLDAQGIAGLASGTLTPLDFIGGIGQSYCGPAIPNSTGLPAIITATGSTFVASNDVRLTCSDATPDFGYFLNSMAQGFVNPPSSNGFLCLGGSIGRHNQPGLVQPGPVFSIQLDLGNMPTPTAFVQVNAGQTWYYQAWYRDSGSSNFSDGIGILFQ